MSVAEKLTTIAENVPKVYDAGKANFGRKKSVTGSYIHVDDVCPTQHKPDIKVKSKNLFCLSKAKIEPVWNGKNLPLKDIVDENNFTFTSTQTDDWGGLYMDGLDTSKTYTLSGTVTFLADYTGTTDQRIILKGLVSDTEITDDGIFLSKRISINLFVGETANFSMTVSGKYCLGIYIKGAAVKIENIQLEEGSVATEYEPYAVSITCCGKNLFDIDSAIMPKTYTISDGVIESKYSIWAVASAFAIPNRILPKGTYTLSATVYKSSEIVNSLGVGLSIGSEIKTMYGYVKWYYLSAYDTWERISVSFTFDEDTEISKMFLQSRGTSQSDVDCKIYFKNIQLEESPTATDYEPYNGTTYTSNTDGTVNDATSVSPIMNIFTDVKSASIECGYYQDVARVNDDSEWSDFWDTVQYDGYRTDYGHAFAGIGWTDENFKPKYNIYPISLSSTFQSSYVTDLIGCLRDCGVTLDCSRATTMSQTFQGSVMTELPEINAPLSRSFWHCFSYQYYIVTIEKLIFADTNTVDWTNAFLQATKLANITMQGTIWQSLSFQWSNDLTVESMKSIISCLKDYSGTDYENKYTISFTSEAKNRLIADGATSPNGNTWVEYIADLKWSIG